MNARAKFLWSVRRELWEHRSIYIAPLAVAALVLLAFLVNLGRFTEQVRSLETLEPGKQDAAAALPFSAAASVVLLTCFVVALVFCLDALYAERRDRSILFWKSMPVSDRTTVLAKLFVPLAVLPLIAFAIALAAQLVLLALSSVVLAAKGIQPSMLWSRLPLGQMTIVMLYGLVVHSLWYAPIYGWLLLVSAWAKKAPFLWAVLPVFAAFVFEKIAFGTSHVTSLVKYRVMGVMSEAFTAGGGAGPVTRLSQLDPVGFLSSPGLWIGLVAAAAFVVAAIRMRRSREPL